MLPSPPTPVMPPIPPPLSSSSAFPLKPRRLHNNHSYNSHNHNHHHHHHYRSPPCEHSSYSAATLDIIILMLVVFSCAFLLYSSLSHVVLSLALVLPPLLAPVLVSFNESPLPYLACLLAFLIASAAVAIALACAGGGSARRCRKPRCRGLKDAAEFDVKVQTEDGMRSPPDQVWKEIESLPWKGGGKGDNPDYECVRKELRRMAPPNGRAVLLFRSRCGCPLSKLEGWGPKKGRRHKKSMASLTLGKEAQ